MKFLQDITFGQYLKGDSFVHTLDPRAKLLSIFILLPLIFSADGPVPFSLLLFIALIAVTLSGINIAFILKGLRQFFWLFLFAAIFHAFFTPGETVSFLPWVSYEGAQEGAIVMIRLVLAVLFSNLLTLTTSPLHLTMAFERLLSPLKHIGVPVSDLAMMMLVAIRFIPILKTEAEWIVKAQKGRGIDLSGGNFLEKIKNIPVLLVPLIHNSFRRADDLAVAMVSRGYVPGAVRGGFNKMGFRAMDYITVCSVFLIAFCRYYYA